MEQKTLRRGNIHAFPWILPRFAVEKLITCTSESCVALSTTEVEYVTACSASCEAVWLRKLLSNLFYLQLDATCIYCDNHSCVKLSENPVFHDKLKHIEIKYHYIRDMVQRGAVKLQYVTTEEHISDVLMKILARLKFEYLREKLGVPQIEVSSKRN